MGSRGGASGTVGADEDLRLDPLDPGAAGARLSQPLPHLLFQPVAVGAEGGQTGDVPGEKEGGLGPVGPGILLAEPGLAQTGDRPIGKLPSPRRGRCRGDHLQASAGPFDGFDEDPRPRGSTRTSTPGIRRARPAGTPRRRVALGASAKRSSIRPDGETSGSSCASPASERHARRGAPAAGLARIPGVEVRVEPRAGVLVDDWSRSPRHRRRHSGKPPIGRSPVCARPGSRAGYLDRPAQGRPPSRLGHPPNNRLALEEQVREGGAERRPRREFEGIAGDPRPPHGSLHPCCPSSCPPPSSATAALARSVPGVAAPRQARAAAGRCVTTAKMAALPDH